MRAPRRTLVCVAVAAVVCAPLQAASPRRLTIDDLYTPQAKLDIGANVAAGLAWIDDHSYAQPKTDPKTEETTWFRVDAPTGSAKLLFDAEKLEAALAAVPGVDARAARRESRSKGLAFGPGHGTVLVSAADDLFLYDIPSGRLTRLTQAPGPEEVAAFSPDGTKVAFVRSNDLRVVELSTANERTLTTGGGVDLLNGKLDWVYQEEVYGRGNFRGFWWSPDSKRIAFLQLDESAVPKFTLEDHLPYRLEVEHSAYPKAGDPNPTAFLGVVAVDEPWPPAFVPWGEYEGEETLIVAVGWNRDSSQIVFNVQDREQTWLDLRVAPSNAASSKKLLRETTRAWVDNNGLPHWLGDGSFLWFSEASGFKHIAHHRADGSLIASVTRGSWEARVLHGVDEASGTVYFSGTPRSPIGQDVYRIKLDGRGLTLLSQVRGTHVASFNRSLTRYIDTWSDVVTPTQVRLHRNDGSVERVIDANPVPVLAELQLSKPEFLQVKARDGFVMEAMMIRPPDFDPRRKYPVLQHAYAGPHSQTVLDKWGSTSHLFHQALAQRGVIVWMCDNRSASGKGAQSTWPAYRRLGETELADIEDGIAWLVKQPYVDSTRIGLEGWSYGGFMTSYALTHSKTFSMGIVGAPVTDWRNYDSIYTERMMRLPSSNPDGYAKSSPRAAAAQMTAKMLVLHGSTDDNVHLQNTLQFAYELQNAGKSFRMMVYPRSRHTFTEPLLIRHLHATMLEFIEETLLQ